MPDRIVDLPVIPITGGETILVIKAGLTGQSSLDDYVTGASDATDAANTAADAANTAAAAAQVVVEAGATILTARDDVEALVVPTGGVPPGAYFTFTGDDTLFCAILEETIEHPQMTDFEDRITGLEDGTALSSRWLGIAPMGDLLHFIIYGQSHSVGRDPDNTGVVTGSLSYARMFAGGVRSYDNGTSAATAYASLSTFQAATYVSPDSKWFSETPTAGALVMVNQLLLAEDGQDVADSGRLLLGSAPGEGGQPLENLADPSDNFTHLTNDITYGQSLGAAGSLIYQPLITMMMHGGADYDSGIGENGYYNGLKQLREDIESAGADATGVTRSMPFINYQIATHIYRSETDPYIARAQLNLALNEDYFGFACPAYFFDFASDGLHYQPESYAWMGAYFGLYAKRWLWDGVKMAPLMPRQSYREGNVVILEFNVEAGRKLVLDHTQVPAQTNEGFHVYDSLGTEVTVSSVALQGTRWVKIVCATDPGADCSVHYGETGDATVANGYAGLGNLRDNAADVDTNLIFDPSGINKPLHTWVPIHQYAVA